MKLKKIKEIAAKLFKTGIDKVWLDPEKETRLKECMTKDDVRTAISEGAIKKKKSNFLSRGKARVLHEKKKKGRKRGMGKRKGRFKARSKPRKKWIATVRAQRRTLRELKKTTKIKPGYSTVYRMIKGGHFKGKKYVETFVKEAAK